MELLEWINLNPKIVVGEVKKKTYNCLYSIVYSAYGARSIRDSRGIYKSLQYRISFSNMNRYWAFRYHCERLDKVNIEQLEKIKEAISTFSTRIKLRIEEPRIFFYAKEEETLFEIANFLIDYRKDLLIVNRPTDSRIAEQLDSGSVILKKSNNYTHKVFLKSGEYKNKQSVIDYLMSLKDTVKVSHAVHRSFINDYNFVWNPWFYTSDPGIEIMLNLIEPNCVRNIHPLAINTQ